MKHFLKSIDALESERKGDKPLSLWEKLQQKGSQGTTANNNRGNDVKPRWTQKPPSSSSPSSSSPSSSSSSSSSGGQERKQWQAKRDVRPPGQPTDRTNTTRTNRPTFNRTSSGSSPGNSTSSSAMSSEPGDDDATEYGGGSGDDFQRKKSSSRISNPKYSKFKQSSGGGDGSDSRGMGMGMDGGDSRRKGCDHHYQYLYYY